MFLSIAKCTPESDMRDDSMSNSRSCTPSELETLDSDVMNGSSSHSPALTFYTRELTPAATTRMDESNDNVFFNLTNIMELLEE